MSRWNPKYGAQMDDEQEKTIIQMRKRTPKKSDKR